MPIIPITPKASSSSSTSSKTVERTDVLGDDSGRANVNSSAETVADGKQRNQNDRGAANLSESGVNDIAGEQRPPPPKSWAELVKRQASQKAGNSASLTSNEPNTNGAGNPKTGSLGEVLQSFSVPSDSKLSFLEPRGLVNTGNMCYMNSVSYQ